MNKTELINQIAEKADLSKKDSDDVQLVDFGSFQVKQRAAGDRRNPKTGEILKIAAANVPNFKAGKTLKEALK